MELKLPAEFKAQWLTALRSGEYKQCTGWLRKDDSFCCLGVAYQAWGGQWGNSHPCVDGNRQFNTLANGHGSYLDKGDVPDEVLTVLDQTTTYRRADGLEEDLGLQRVLANMNDKHVPFETIADWIEREL